MKRQICAPEAIQPPDGVDHVLAALSGGADSVYLLRALLAGGARVTAAHFHHGLRESADEDLRFCRELCKELDVPLHEGRAGPDDYAQLKGMGLETAARELRYRFLRETRRTVGADVIALGHHLNDQAETVLMHLLRGSGLRGACGMAEREGDLYRPLLHLSKKQIVERLEVIDAQWREDETNAVSDNPRNALRNEILPQMRGIYPGADAALARFADIAREDEQFIGQMAEDVLRRQVRRMPNGWRVDSADEISAALLKRIFMRLTGIRDMQMLGSMANISKTGRKRADFTNFRLEQHGENLYIIDMAFCAPEPAEFRCDGETRLDGVCRMHAEPWAPQPELSGGMVQVLSRRALEGAQLRTRRKGDWIRPLGAPGTKSLSDYLTDRKIPRPQRDVLPLLACGDEVLWVVGVGVSEAVRVDADTEAIRICCDMAEATARYTQKKVEDEEHA